MNKLKTISSLILSTLFFPFAAALQQSGGPLIAYTPIGGSNETKWGIGNNDNITVTLKMRAEGEAATYVSFPTSIEIESGKFVYIPIKVTLPKNETLLGENITGSMYALLEGKSGSQVVINLQAKKSITIIPYESAVEVNQQAEGTNPLSGFFGMATVKNNFIIIISAVVVAFAGIALYLTKFRKKEVKK